MPRAHEVGITACIGDPAGTTCKAAKSVEELVLILDGDPEDDELVEDRFFAILFCFAITPTFN